MKQDSTHSIFHSAKRFFSGTMLSRVSGMMRDMVMAYAFGTQEAVAAFMVAFRFSHLLRRLFGEGALQSAFIPQFEHLRKNDPQRAFQFFRDLLVILSAGLLVTVVLAASILGACLIYFDFSEGNREIIFLTALMLPSLLFICLFGINASLLQCEKIYFLPGVAPVAFNVTWIVGVLCLWHLPTEKAMPWLAGGVIIACMAQWIVTIPKTLSVLRNHSLSFLWFSEDIKKFAKPLFLGILGVAASQINNAVDAIFARYADPEGPALLWYALRLQQLPLAIFGIAISGALLPPLTRALKSDDLSKFRHFLEFAIRRSFALMLPLTAAILVMGDSSINLIYGHGDFTDHSTIGTVWCLWAYGVGLVPMTLVLILAPAFYSRGNYRIPTIASVASMVLNVLLNTVLIAVFNLGAASVAIATSISSVLNCVLLGWFLREDLCEIFSRVCLVNLAKVVIVSILVLMAGFIYYSNFLPILLGYPVRFPHSIISQCIQLLSQAGCFIAILFISAYVIKAEDITGFHQTPIQV